MPTFPVATATILDVVIVTSIVVWPDCRPLLCGATLLLIVIDIVAFPCLDYPSVTGDLPPRYQRDNTPLGALPCTLFQR